MKRFLNKIKAFSIKLNMLIVSLLLAIIYILVITPYSLFFKKRKANIWTERNKVFTKNDILYMW